MSKPVYLGVSILELSKTVMCQSWYDYGKPKYEEKGDISKDIGDAEKRFDTSNYELKRLLRKGKHHKDIGLMKD